MKEFEMMQVLADQRGDLLSYKNASWCNRIEEQQFEWESDMAQVVIGVRRSGKSTLCHKALINHKVKYAYATFDDDRLSEMKSSDFNLLLECIYRTYGTDVKYIFFDEIQNVDGWHLFVNRLLRSGFHMFITGSNARLLSSELATHLTGRYNEIRLYPFSFSEVCRFNNIPMYDMTTLAMANLKEAFVQYLLDGGLPEMFKIKNLSNRRIYVESLIETIIRKDITLRFHLRNNEALRLVANHLINNVGQDINFQNLSELANFRSLSTTQKYVSYLTQAFLINTVQKFSFKSRERLRHSKAYVIDSGFIANRNNALLPENLGWRLENAVFVELLRRNRSEANDIYYYKPTARSKEVDFVVCRQGLVTELIQVAYDVSDSKTLKREVDALVSVAAKLNCSNLTLICMNETETINVNNYCVNKISALKWFTNTL